MKIMEMVYKERGFDFRQYKATSLERRLQKRLHALNLKSYRDYLARLGEDPAEYDRLINTLLINVTEFFRDREAFDVIRDKVLPDVIACKTGARPELKIWSAGCASGEEAYSMAILLSELSANKSNNFEVMPQSLGEEMVTSSVARHGVARPESDLPAPIVAGFAKAGGPRDQDRRTPCGATTKPILPIAAPLHFEFSVYGTDIDKDSLAQAQEGTYRAEAVKGKMTDEIPGRYFVKSDSLRVKDSVKRTCHFIFHDLVLDRPLKAMDIVLCRNVAIYFERALQEKIYADFYSALNEKGYLCLGKAETLIGPAQEKFEVIDKRWKIYKIKK